MIEINSSLQQKTGQRIINPFVAHRLDPEENRRFQYDQIEEKMNELKDQLAQELGQEDDSEEEDESDSEEEDDDSDEEQKEEKEGGEEKEG